MVHYVGAGDTLAGVTHECDYPRGVERLPKLTASKIDGCASSAEIDAAVGRLSDEGSIYDLDADLLRELEPDLIITQGLCDVCAVSVDVVREAAAKLPAPPRILSLNPTSLEDVFTDLVAVGGTLGHAEEARKEVADLRTRLARVGEAVADRGRPRVGCIEWLDPPFSAGHWVPEMARLAGGEEVFAAPGEPSKRITWEEVFEAAPEILVLMPCGFDVERAVQEARSLPGLPGWAELPAVKSGRVWTVDANSYFSRPAPRLVGGVEILARILHPEAFDDAPDPGAALRFDAPRSASRAGAATRPGGLRNHAHEDV
jgi:iron complex transport system substrate-binding protein